NRKRPSLFNLVQFSPYVYCYFSRFYFIYMVYYSISLYERKTKCDTERCERYFEVGINLYDTSDSLIDCTSCSYYQNYTASVSKYGGGTGERHTDRCDSKAV